MTSVLTRVRDIFAPASTSSSSKSRSRSRLSPSRLSPSRRTRKGSSPQERVIPPEPIQQRPDGGELHSTEVEPALRAHNLARANKMVPKLEWDDRLAHDAESYAKLIAATGVLEHAGQEAQGENLFVKTGDDVKYEEAVKSWMGEEQSYHGEVVGEGDLDQWRHFSQCVWHSTTHVGMGKATSKDGKTYIVARYSPRGNIAGEKPFAK